MSVPEVDSLSINFHFSNIFLVFYEFKKKNRKGPKRKKEKNKKKREGVVDGVGSQHRLAPYHLTPCFSVSFCCFQFLIPTLYPNSPNTIKP